MATRYELPRESELRVDAEWDSEIYLQTIDGIAEIFGTELPRGRWLKFPPAQNFAIFSWTGATVEIRGAAGAACIANETPMRSYFDVHSLLENKRAQAREATFTMGPSYPEGPRVIVVGPTDSGKSSLTKMLLGWATRQGWKPMFADLDLGQGSLTIPGTVAATVVDVPVDPVEGIPLETPLVYFYGHTSPSVNPDLYKSLAKELAHASAIQMERSPETRQAGLIINTMGWVKDLGYELLLHTIEAFNANIILVLGQEDLHHDLQDQFGGRSGMDILNLCKSKGVVTRDQNWRRWTRNSRTREYFYGLSNTLLPHQDSVSFSEVCVYCFGAPSTSKLASSDGNKMMMAPTSPVFVRITQDFIHSVLAVSYAKEPDQLLSSLVAGFIYVTNVDVSRRRMWYMAPCPGPLPNNLLLIGSLYWRD